MNLGCFGERAWAVRADDISALNEEQLPALLKILLAAEARGRCVQYHVPEQVRAKDRGQDGYWKYSERDVGVLPGKDTASWRREIEQFIPADEVVYQCKAVEKNLTQGRFLDEIFRSKKSCKFKDAVEEVIESGGAYVMLWGKQNISCKEDTLRRAIEKRWNGTGKKLPEDVVIKALDANKIAEWTNRHPSAVLYVNGFRTPSMAFGQISEEWGAVHKFNTPFRSSRYLKELEDKIIPPLKEGNALIRLTGASGIGKSRFIFEIIKREPVLEKSSVFINGSVLSEENLLGLINYLKKKEIRTLLIVDDCQVELHEKLACSILKTEINLITISCDSSQVGSSASHYTLEAREMHEVIYKMLSHSGKFKRLDGFDNIIRILLRYAEGLPMIAEMFLELGRPLNPEEFMSRAGVYRSIIGRLTPNANRVLRALSLFSSLGGIRGNLYRQESSIREVFCGGINEDYYDDAIAELEEKKLLRYDSQSRSLRVVPTPLAAAFASEYIVVLSKKSTERLTELFKKMKDTGLFASFLQRFDDLSRNYALQEITNVLVSLFYYATDHGYREEAKSIFLAFSKINPDNALNVAEITYRYRLLPGKQSGTAASYSDLVPGLVELAWSYERFERAARLLAFCAATEHTTNTEQKDARRAFYGLFTALHANTDCPAKERLPVLKEVLYSHDIDMQEIGVQAFDAVFEFYDFCRWGDIASRVDVQSPKRSWYPKKSNAEVIDDYWKNAYFMLADYIVGGNRFSENALELLGKNLHPIISTPLLLKKDVYSVFIKIVQHARGAWTPALDVIKHALKYGKVQSNRHQKVLGNIVKMMLSNEWPLSSQIRNHVSEPMGGYTDAARLKAEELAEQLVSQLTQQGKNLPANILADLLQGTQRYTSHFGVVFGRLCNVEQLKTLFDDAFAEWTKIQKERRADFLIGVLRGMGADHPLRYELLQRVGNSPALMDLLVPFTNTIPAVDMKEISIVIDRMIDDSIPTKTIETYTFALTNFNSQQTVDFMCLLQKLWEQREDATFDLIHILYVHLEYHKGNYHEAIRKLNRRILCTPSIQTFSEEWAYMAGRELDAIVERDEPRDWVTGLFCFMRATVDSMEHPYDSEDGIRCLLGHAASVYPYEVLDFIASLLRVVGGSQCLKHVFRYALDNEGQSSWFLSLPSHELETWVRANSDIALHLLSLVPLWRNIDGNIQWCQHVKWLVDVVVDSEYKIASCMRSNWGGGCYTNNERMQHWEVCKAAAQVLVTDSNARMRYIGRLLLIDIASEIDTHKNIEAHFWCSDDIDECMRKIYHKEWDENPDAAP